MVLQQLLRWTAVGAVLAACKGNDASPAPIASSAPVTHDTTRFTPTCDRSFAPRPERDASPMCNVPAGDFTMGTPVDPKRPQDGPARRVRISHDFAIDQYEVTIAQ